MNPSLLEPPDESAAQATPRLKPGEALSREESEAVAGFLTPCSCEIINECWSSHRVGSSLLHSRGGLDTGVERGSHAATWGEKEKNGSRAEE